MSVDPCPRCDVVPCPWSPTGLLCRWQPPAAGRLLCCLHLARPACMQHVRGMHEKQEVKETSVPARMQGRQVQPSAQHLHMEQCVR